jgi:hypothetical protein
MKVSASLDLRGPHLVVTVDTSEPLVQHLLADAAQAGTLLRVELKQRGQGATIFAIRPVGNKQIQSGAKGRV